MADEFFELRTEGAVPAEKKMDACVLGCRALGKRRGQRRRVWIGRGQDAACAGFATRSSSHHHIQLRMHLLLGIAFTVRPVAVQAIG